MNRNFIIPVEILLIEDKLGGIDPIQYSLKENKLCNLVNVVRDTDEGLRYILQDNNMESGIPDIILANINLYTDKELDVLSKIKNTGCRKKDIIILTNNSREEFILKRRQISGNFLRRPFNFVDFITWITKKFDFGILINKQRIDCNND